MLNKFTQLFTNFTPKGLLNKISFNYIRPKKKNSLSNPFTYQEIKIEESAKNNKKKYGYLQFGLYGLVFACCFAGIPLYRVFCEHVGLVGNYDKKTYEFKKEKGIPFSNSSQKP